MSRRMLALAVCESIQHTTPRFRRPASTRLRIAVRVLALLLLATPLLIAVAMAWGATQ